MEPVLSWSRVWCCDFALQGWAWRAVRSSIESSWVNSGMWQFLCDFHYYVITILFRITKNNGSHILKFKGFGWTYQQQWKTLIVKNSSITGKQNFKDYISKLTMIWQLFVKVGCLNISIKNSTGNFWQFKNSYSQKVAVSYWVTVQDSFLWSWTFQMCSASNRLSKEIESNIITVIYAKQL